jgi:transposase
MLEEHEKISISDNTARTILNAAGIKSPKTKRKPRKHHRRKRREYEGALEQTDATEHEFFDTDEKQCLHGVIDDATGKIVGLYMSEHECLEGYFAVFEQMIVNFGIPASIYADRHTIFASPKSDKLTIEDELAGIQVNDTQLGRAVRELGITLIKARSAQAKGRIERLWQTLQDRLVIEFRIRGIKDMDAANQFLQAYIPEYNKRFGVEAAEKQSLFTPNTFDLINILCVRETRKVDDGGAFSYCGKCFVVLGDILPRVSIEVIAHRKLGIFALYKNKRYDVQLIEKTKRRKKPPSNQPQQRTAYVPLDSHYHKHGKESFVQYSNEYSDAEILAILDDIFLKSFK